eukprot:781607_1
MYFDRLCLIYLALAVLSNRCCVAMHDSWDDDQSKANNIGTTPRQRITRSINSEVSLNHPWVGRLTIIEKYADGTSWSPLGTAFMFNHPNYMLTVAHVCYGHRSPASTMSVEAYVEFQDGTKISVDWISFYDGFLRDIANSPGHERPKYFRTKNDACMIHLTEPRNVELPQIGTSASQTLQEDDTVYSVGFGEFDQNGSQKCDTPSDLTKPRMLKNRIKYISEASIALHSEIKQHACPGDSGSPLFIHRNGRTVVVGIASGAQFSEPNDRTSTPIRTVFTPISPIKKLMYCASPSDCPAAPSRHLVYTNRSLFRVCHNNLCDYNLHPGCPLHPITASFPDAEISSCSRDHLRIHPSSGHAMVGSSCGARCSIRRLLQIGNSSIQCGPGHSWVGTIECIEPPFCQTDDLLAPRDSGSHGNVKVVPWGSVETTQSVTLGCHGRQYLTPYQPMVRCILRKNLESKEYFAEWEVTNLNAKCMYGCFFNSTAVAYIRSRMRVQADPSTSCTWTPGSTHMAADGTECPFTCERGYSPVGSPTVVCRTGHWVSDDLGAGCNRDEQNPPGDITANRQKVANHPGLKSNVPSGSENDLANKTHDGQQTERAKNSDPDEQFYVKLTAGNDGTSVKCSWGLTHASGLTKSHISLYFVKNGSSVDPARIRTPVLGEYETRLGNYFFQTKKSKKYDMYCDVIAMGGNGLWKHLGYSNYLLKQEKCNTLHIYTQFPGTVISHCPPDDLIDSTVFARNGAACFVHCVSGFNVGSSQVTCGESGRWVGNAICGSRPLREKCSRAHFQNIEKVTVKFRQPTRKFPRKAAIFGCETGYVLKRKVDHVLCLDDGQWETITDQPICKRTCPIGEDVEGSRHLYIHVNWCAKASLTGGVVYEGMRCVAFCADSILAPVRSPAKRSMGLVTCQSDGHWSGNKICHRMTGIAAVQK